MNVILAAIGIALTSWTAYAMLGWMRVPRLKTLDQTQNVQRMVLAHAPGYGQFYIQDPTTAEGAVYGDLEQSRRMYCGTQLLAPLVVSEFSEIPITVDFYREPPAPDTGKKWDRIVECSLDAESGLIVFAGCPDGPYYGRFGAVSVKPGRYRVRVHFGGQSSAKTDGSSSDFYLIQIWRSDKAGPQVLKPDI